MTREEADKLRAAWKDRGESECLHPYLSLQVTGDHYHSDHYFCMLCGAEVSCYNSPETPH